MGSWLGAGHQKDHTGTRRLELSAPPHTLEWGEGLKVESMPPGCPSEEASIKSQQHGVGRASGMNAWRYQEKGIPGDGVEGPRPFLHTLP